jgi:Retrotransposon gag protein/Zinc knuckle
MDAQLQAAIKLMTEQFQAELQTVRNEASQQHQNHLREMAAVQAAATAAASAAAGAAGSAAGAAGAAGASAAAVAAVVPPARGPSLRIAPPAHYNGSTPPLDDWLASIRQQFAFYQLASNAERVRFAAAHLKGPALDWWEHPGAGSVPSTWAEIEAGLRARFQPVTTAETARVRLAALEQGKHSINDYVAIFRRLIVAVPTMDAESQLFAFTHGLNKHLYMLSRQVMPATLEEAIALAVRMGTAGPMANVSSSSSGSSAMDLSVLRAELDGHEAVPTTTPSAEAPVTRAEFTTLLAAIQQSNNRRGGDSAGSSRGAQGASGGVQWPRGLPRIKGFTPEKVQQYMDANKCFRCNVVGHASRDCPLRKVDSNGRVTWSN